MEYPKDSFNTKNESKDLNEAEANFEVKKSILITRARQYIEKEAILVSNTIFLWNNMGTVYSRTTVSFEGK